MLLSNLFMLAAHWKSLEINEHDVEQDIGDLRGVELRNETG